MKKLVIAGLTRNLPYFLKNFSGIKKKKILKISSEKFKILLAKVFKFWTPKFILLSSEWQNIFKKFSKISIFQKIWYNFFINFFKMSKNTKIILGFLISGIILGALDSIFFYIPLVWLPIYIFYKVMNNSIILAGIFLFISALAWWMNFWGFVFAIYLFSFILLCSK